MAGLHETKAGMAGWTGSGAKPATTGVFPDSTGDNSTAAWGGGVGDGWIMHWHDPLSEVASVSSDGDGAPSHPSVQTSFEPVGT